MNTQNLQRTLRRAVFKHFFEDGYKNEQIIVFFERLESELPGINTL